MVSESSDSEYWGEYARAAQDGDKKAYTQLLRAITPYIRNVLMKSLSNADAADDIAQEVLISVHKSLNTYSPDRPFKPWLYSIISFRRTDYLRKYYSSKDNKSAPLEHADFYESGVTKPEHAGEYKDIEAALSTLPEQQRRIFTMLKIEGYSTQEVANEMKMNESAVKVSAHRTMKKLRGLLE